ncbi:MAG: transglutaminase domain-containing protein [Proteobacteria bacterium]|nr:transglutaminase domain-containing protein [Pseudomonadota bacterium]
MVFYVRSRVASYWRGRTLQTFDGAHWLTGDVVNPFERSTDNDRVWNNRDALFQNNPRLYEQTFLLQRDQPDSVFTGYGALRIIADEGSLDTFALRRGDSYQVISALPQHTPEVLGQDYAAGVSIQFKALPPNSEGLRTLAGQITLGSANDFEKAQRIVSYLDLNGRVEPGGLGNLTSMATLDEFLFEGKAGTVLDNATATVMLARASGLPARLAIGYLPGVRDRLSGAYVVRVGDAHAWAEVRFVDGGWVPFDSASTSDVDNPWHFGATVGDLFKGIVGKDPFGFKGSIGQDVFGAIGAVPSRVGIALSTGLSRPGLSRALMIAGPLGFLYLLVIRWLWRRGAGRRRTNEGLVSGYSKLSGEGRRELLNLYSKAEKLIQQKAGGRRMPWQTVEGYTRLAAQGNIEVQPHLSWFVQAVNQAAYSPDELPAGLVEETASRLKRLRAALKGSKRSGNALFGRHVWEPN